jgi:hypothetical protein
MADEIITTPKKKGFSVKTAIPIITVPLVVNTFDEDAGETTEVSVKHKFIFPDTPVRDGYQKRLVTSKGRKVRTENSAANWWLWLQCIKAVEGYDDLVIDKEGQWKRVFDSSILRIHAENAAAVLMQTIDAQEGDTEKKSEPSSVL